MRAANSGEFNPATPTRVSTPTSPISHGDVSSLGSLAESSLTLQVYSYGESFENDGIGLNNSAHGIESSETLKNGI